MKFLYDLLPVIFFFIAYKLYGIYTATFIAIMTAVLQLGYALIRRKPIDMIQWLSLGAITLLGGATLLFKNELFIKWKPTAIYWLMGLVFFFSQYFGPKPLKPIAQRMMEKSVALSAPIWKKLNLSWVLFFTVMGGLNLLVVYTCDTNTWVNFKLFGSFGLTLLFVLLQAVVLSKISSPAAELSRHK
jgi:intracellular septation protein